MIKTLNLVVTTPRWRRMFFSFLLTATALAGLAVIRSSRATDQAGSPNQSDSAKIAPWVVEQTAKGDRAEFIVVLADQADLSSAAMLRAKIDKGRFVHDALRNKAQTTQGPILQWLRDPLEVALAAMGVVVWPVIELEAIMMTLRNSRPE